jgi:hypothetical protein
MKGRKNKTCSECPSGIDMNILMNYIEYLDGSNTGLIGEKVVWNEKYIKMNSMHGWSPEPLPECGYFRIKKATLCDDGKVRVSLYGGDRHYIYIGWLKKYKEDKEQ